MEEERIRQFAADFEAVEREIGKVIIGQKELIRHVLTAMIAGGNVLLEGMRGWAKRNWSRRSEKQQIWRFPGSSSHRT